MSEENFQSSGSQKNTEEGALPVSVPQEQILELIPAFALGCTDAAESALVKRHLHDTTLASHELSDFSRLANRLLYAAPPVAAPPALRQKLLAAIAASPDLPVTPPAASQTVQPFEVSPTAAPTTRRWFDWAKLRSGLQWGIAGAALALLASNWYWADQLRTLQENQQRLGTDIARQRTAITVLAMDDSQRLHVPSVEAGNPTHATVIWGKGFNVALLYVEDFPYLEYGKQYQLWLHKGEARTSGGLFRVNEAGTGTLLVELPADFTSFDSLGITTEPYGGSPSPTTPLIVTGSIKASSW